MVDLKQRMKNILNNDTIGINLFFAIKGDDGIKIKVADIDNGETTNNLIKQFKESLKEEFLLEDDISVEKVSEAEEGKKSYYYYDYDEFPDNMEYYKNFTYGETYEEFSFSDDELVKIEAFILVFGTEENHVVMYKKFYPIFLLGRGSFCMVKSNTRFVEFDKELIRISADYQFIKVDNDIFIKDLKVFEKFGGFKKIIEKDAAKCVKEIKKLEIVDDVEYLKDALEDDVSFARKLSKIKRTSAVFQLEKKGEELIKFAKSLPNFEQKFKLNDEGTKFRIDKKKYRKQFLCLLEDGFLKSELTNIYYASISKERF